MSTYRFYGYFRNLFQHSAEKKGIFTIYGGYFIIMCKNTDFYSCSAGRGK